MARNSEFDQQPIARSPEFYRQRREFRRDLRSTLPWETQLAYPTERPGTNFGVPLAEMVWMGQSKDPKSELFLETLRQSRKLRSTSGQKSGITVEQTIDSSSRLRNIAEQEQDRRKMYASLLGSASVVALSVPSLLRQEEYAALGRITARLSDRSLARSAIYGAIQNNRPVEAGIIAGETGFLPLAKPLIAHLLLSDNPGAAAQIAITLGDPDVARETMQLLSENGNEEYAASIESVLDDLPERRKQYLRQVRKQDQEAYKALGNSEDANNRTPEELVSILRGCSAATDFHRFEKLYTNLLATLGIEDGEFYFCFNRLSDRIQKGEDAGLLLLEDIPRFRAIKEKSREINSQLPENKREQDLDKFWVLYQVHLAKLLSIDPNLGQSLVLTKARQSCFGNLEDTLTTLEPLTRVDISEISNLLHRTKNPSTAYLESLIEYAAIYNGLKLTFSTTSEQIQADAPVTAKQTLSELGKHILAKYAKDTNTHIDEEQFRQWNLPYLGKLFNGLPNFGDHVHLIILTSLTGDFANIIHGEPTDQSEYTEEGQKLINDLQQRNREVRLEFANAGIDYETFHHYPGRREFSAGMTEEEIQKQKDALQAELSQAVYALIGKKSEEVPGMLNPDEAKRFFTSILKKNGITFEDGKMLVNGSFDLPAVGKPVEDMIQFLVDLQTHSPDPRITATLDSIANLGSRSAVLLEQQKCGHKRFEIKIWDRQPGYDLFQGNYTANCLATNGEFASVMHDYLLDTSMGCIEIRDKTTGNVIGQSFTFFAQDQEQNTTLMLDSVDIDGEYIKFAPLIRSQLLRFAREYADACISDPSRRVDSILLGDAVYGNIDYNDVPTNDLRKKRTQLRKIGRAGFDQKQYLDSFYTPQEGQVQADPFVDPTEFNECNVNIVQTGLKSAKPETVIYQPGSWLSMREDILDVEHRTFGELGDSEEDLIETFETPDSITVLLTEPSDRKRVVGFAHAEHRDIRAYVTSLGLVPEYQGRGLGLDLVDSLAQELRSRGIRTVGADVAVDNGFAAKIQNSFGDHIIHIPIEHDSEYGRQSRLLFRL